MNRTLLPIYRSFRKLLSGRGLKRFSIVQNLDKSIKNRFWSNYVVTIDGLKMYLIEGSGDSIELSTFGSYEQTETELVKKIIKKGNTVIDVGASVGYYTLLLAKIVGDTGRIFSFEADVTRFSILQKNVALNNFANVVMENNFISDNTKKNHYDNYVSLDDYFSNHVGNIDLIKMDIEGAEGLALKGMTEILKKNKDIKILTEFHTNELKKFGTKPVQFLNDLHDLGFSIYNINEKKKSIDIITNEDLLLDYPRTEVFTNLLCKRD
jgi:hypothetical protein